MRPKTYHVSLVPDQREELTRQSTSQRHSARERKRACILLLADEDRGGGAVSDKEIASQVQVCTMTVGRVRQRFAQAKDQAKDQTKDQAKDQGDTAVQKALYHKEQEKRKARVLDGVAEAHLIALTCSTPPEGRKEWSLHLLKDTLIEQRIVDSISHETVRQTLKKMHLSRG